MTLKDLKQGMVCELRNKGNFTVLEDMRLYQKKLALLPCKVEEIYNDDLTHKKLKYFDIMKITYGDKVVFERKESRWFVPKVNEKYFYTNEFGEISSTLNSQFSGDIAILNNNRVFKTEEEAEKRVRQEQATLSVERWITENDVEVDLYDTDAIKWSFVYDIDLEKIVAIVSYHHIIMPKQFILSSEEKVEQLIKEREKELKIMLGVEE